MKRMRGKHYRSNIVSNIFRTLFYQCEKKFLEIGLAIQTWFNHKEKQKFAPDLNTIKTFLYKNFKL